jgi:hypothetical protein
MCPVFLQSAEAQETRARPVDSVAKEPFARAAAAGVVCLLLSIATG